jgi:hypothetical protein
VHPFLTFFRLMSMKFFNGFSVASVFSVFDAEKTLPLKCFSWIRSPGDPLCDEFCHICHVTPCRIVTEIVKSSMLICCDGELSLRRPNTQCCGSKTFDSETHQCCRDTIISKAVGCNNEYSKFLFSILTSLNEGDQFIH